MKPGLFISRHTQTTEYDNALKKVIPNLDCTGGRRNYPLAWVQATAKKYAYVFISDNNHAASTELINNAKKTKLKTVVIPKEGMLSPLTFGPVVSKHSAQPDLICCWGEKLRNLWLSVGYPEKKLPITGSARFDYYATAPKKEQNNYKILYLSYPNYSWFYHGFKGYDPKKSTKRLQSETIRLLSVMKPHCELWFKLHPQQHSIHAGSRLHIDCIPWELKNLNKPRPIIPKHQIIHGDTDLRALIARADLVVSFMSTGLLEAIIMNKPVIYTKWDYVSKIKNGIEFDTWNTCFTANTREEFKKYLHQFQDGNLLVPDVQQPGRERLIREYAYKIDGQACKRIKQEVEKIL